MIYRDEHHINEVDTKAYARDALSDFQSIFDQQQQ